MEYRYFNGKKNSNFRTLDRITQRAIETQANIDLEAQKRSKYLKRSYESESVQKYFFEDKCEKYAEADKDTLSRLRILESKALYLYPEKEKRFQYWETQAQFQAEQIDRKIDSLQQFKNFERD